MADHIITCDACGRTFNCAKKLSPSAKRHKLAWLLKNHECSAAKVDTAPFEKNWSVSCCNCGEKPTVGTTQLCGPCCFGEAATVAGNW